MFNIAFSPPWLKFLKPKVDFFELLRQQAGTTLAGVISFKEWLGEGATGKCKKVHELEHKADTQKMEVEKKLAATFVTPFDPEDIYDISARLDLIINGIKKVAKDMECFGAVEPDQYMSEMCDVLICGTEFVVCAIDNLEKDLRQTGVAANHSRKTETKLEETHRRAMKVQYQEKDFTQVIRTKEVYDSLAVVAGRIESLGEKLLHLSIQLS